MDTCAICAFCIEKDDSKNLYRCAHPKMIEHASKKCTITPRYVTIILNDDKSIDKLQQVGCTFIRAQQRVNTKTNQGNVFCFKCNKLTIKIKGYRHLWDYCPVCKI